MSFWSSSFSFPPRLGWQAASKKTKVKLDLLGNIDMLLMSEKGFRGGICHAIYHYVKVKNKYMKDHNKNKESPYLKYCDVNNFYGLVMSQTPVNNFKWVEDISEFDESFIKDYKDTSLKLISNAQKIYVTFPWKNENWKKLKNV